MKSIRLLLLLAIVACVPESEPSEDPSVLIDTLPGGVIRARNPEPATPLPWHFVEEQVISPAEGSPGELSRPRGLAGLEGGGVVVMQSAPDRMTVFGADGSFLRSIGRAGEGPGEFVEGAIGRHGDTILVHDPTHTRASLFLPDGTFLTSWRAPCCLIGPGEVWVDGLGQAWMPTFGRGGASFLRYRFDGTLVDTIPATPHRRRQGIWTINNGTSAAATGIPLVPVDHWLPTPDGLFAYGVDSTYRIVIGKNGRDTLRIIEASGEGRLATPSERDSLLKDAMPKSGSARDALMRVAKIEDIPLRWPAWTEMRFDSFGLLWVGRPGASTGAPVLDVFAPNGERLGSVLSPHPLLLRGSWVGDRVYAIDEDNVGAPVVRVYRLVKERLSQ